MEKGAEVNIKDKYECPPLHIAIRHGYAEICALLTEKGAELNGTDLRGWQPLTNNCYTCLKQ